MSDSQTHEAKRRAHLVSLQRKLGHVIADLSLLDRALTHTSYVNEHPGTDTRDNERLEFLGDAVLDFLTAEHLFQRFPEMSEGQLTSLRVALVRTETLASLADDLHLGDHLRLGRGEEAGGGRLKPTNLCAAFEALVGAVVLDGGIDEARSLIFPLIEPLVEELLATPDLKDAKTRLQELCQAGPRLTPTYETTGESGPDHAKRFVVVVRLDGQVLGKGKGSSKQAAQQAAAADALRKHFPDDSAHSDTKESEVSSRTDVVRTEIPEGENTCT